MNIQNIERKIQAMNDAVFQSLCDALILSLENHREVHRIGSMASNEKTRKGRPDSLFVSKNGRYIPAEYTTLNGRRHSKLLEKLKTDFADCLDSRQTGINKVEVDKVILGYNSKLNAAGVTALKAFSLKEGVELELMGLDFIALKLFTTHKYLAREFLDISLDSGQILPTDVFVKEYERLSIHTTLSNTYMFRHVDLKNVTDRMSEHDILILSGQAGVGKSKLAIEAMKLFEQENPLFTVFCITSKNASIWEDLRIYLNGLDDFLLLIDDANRQANNLNSILSILRETRSGKLKLLVTVRDYAKEEIRSLCRGFKTDIKLVNPLSELEIQDLVQSSHNINDAPALTRISTIAKGNPRLAMMAARAFKVGGPQALTDVLSIYREHFQSFAEDKEIFSSRTFLASAGFVSFFYAVDLGNVDYLNERLGLFHISRKDLVEQVHRMEEMEIVDVYENDTVKINDQTLATYLFYKTFVELKVLDIEVLLLSFHNSHLHRIKDTLIASNETFGDKQVFGKINRSIEAFWEKVNGDSEGVIHFFDLFRFFRSERFFGYIEQRSLTVDIDRTQNFEFVESTHSFQTNDSILQLLTGFFKYQGSKFTMAIHSANSYVIRYPALYSQFIRALQSELVVNSQDVEKNLFRQSTLGYIIRSLNNFGKLKKAMFFDLFPLLMYPINNFELTRVKALSTDPNPLEKDGAIDIYRGEMWKDFIEAMKEDRVKSLRILSNYVQSGGGLPFLSLYRLDQPYIIQVLSEAFDASNFDDVYVATKYRNSLVAWGLASPDLHSVWKEFHKPNIELLFLIDPKYIRRHSGLDLKVDYEVYESMKEAEIIKSVDIRTMSDFKVVFSQIQQFTKSNFAGEINIHHNFDLILAKTFSQNPALGMKIFLLIIGNGNSIGIWPYRIFLVLFKAKSKLSRPFFNLIIKGDFDMKIDWIIRYFDHVPLDEILPDDITILLEELKSSKQFKRYWWTAVTRIALRHPELPMHVLTNLLKWRQQSPRFRYEIPEAFFQNNENFLKLHKRVAQSVYLHQCELQNHFDSRAIILIKLISLDNDFLDQYLRFIYSKGPYVDASNVRGVELIWELPNADQLIYKALVRLRQKQTYITFLHYANAFFQNLTAATKLLAI